MAKGVPVLDVDRRDFLNGRWPGSDKVQANKAFEIASILVQTRPERLDATACGIAALPGTQIYSRDPQGKLVAVIEADNVGAIGDVLNAISSMPHVLSAALVFHGTDEG